MKYFFCYKTPISNKIPKKDFDIKVNKNLHIILSPFHTKLINFDFWAVDVKNEVIDDTMRVMRDTIAFAPDVRMKTPR